MGDSRSATRRTGALKAYWGLDAAGSGIIRVFGAELLGRSDGGDSRTRGQSEMMWLTQHSAQPAILFSGISFRVELP